ncbi:MAG: holo-ACP synthase [Clostridiales bacterium]|nr:holo-ACP synthase [Clostridiales bacterium]
MNIRSGVDTVYIPRILKSLQQHGDTFMDKCLSPSEKKLALSYKSEGRRAEFVAGRFASKEAVSKALGTGIMSEGIVLSDIEVLPNESGAPVLTLSGEAHNMASLLNVISSSVSITHEKDYATAICVLLCDEEVR